MYLVLRPVWTTESFSRTIRDEKGRVLVVLQFEKKVPVLITDERQLAGIADDIGAALVVACEVAKGPVKDGEAPETVWRPSMEATEQAILWAAELRLSAKKPLLRHQQLAIEHKSARAIATQQKLDKLADEMESVAEQIPLADGADLEQLARNKQEIASEMAAIESAIPLEQRIEDLETELELLMESGTNQARVDEITGILAELIGEPEEEPAAVESAQPATGKRAKKQKQT